MKKVCFILFFVCTIFLSSNFIFCDRIALADDNTQVSKEIEDELNKQIGNLDFKEVEKVIAGLNGIGKNIFSSSSFLEKINSILTGEFAENSTSFLDSIVKFLFESILSYMPLVATIIAVAVLGGMVENLKPMSNKRSIGNVVHFVTYGFIIILLGTSLVSMITMAGNTINSINSQMEAIFPILLTILTAIGGTVSVSVYQPTFALISGIILKLFNYILMPIFIFSIVFSLVSNMSNNIKLDKFIKFFNSLFKWIIGLIFTIFIGFTTLQGISASGVDGLSIRTAKYAIKSYIPILGGYVSDGLNIILASSVLIKNAVGVAGLFLIAATIISPIIELVVFMFALKLVAGIIEPIGDKKIASFMTDISKNLSMLIALIVGVSFMYIILVGLVMCSANIG